MKKFIVLLILTFLIPTVFGISVNNIKIDKSHFKLENTKNISIDKSGKIMLSPEIKNIFNTESLIVFDIKKINNYLYVATGNKSFLYKIDLSAEKIDESNIKVVYKGKDIAVSLLEYDGKNNLFFVESNTIYSYNIDTEKIEEFASLKDENIKYIWAMVYLNNKLYVSTGENAKIIMIEGKGKVKTIFENNNENHFLTLVYNNTDNSLYFGSEGLGILYRMSLKDMKTESLYDTYEDEISSIYIDKDAVYFCTSSQVRKKVGLDFDYTDSFKKQEKPKETQDKESAKQPKLKNSVYKYEKGKIYKLFTLDETVFYTLTKIEDKILVGASGGSIYLYNLKNSFLSLHSKILDEQIVKIIPDKKNIYVASGNLGKIYKIGLSYSNTGEAISNIIDLESISKIGKAIIKSSIPKDSNIMLYIRGGNTEDIDNTWSEWKGPYTYQNEINLGIEKSRYIQYKIIFNTKNLEVTPIIEYIIQIYSPQNRSPSISYFNIKTTKTLDKNQRGQKSELTLEWNAYDADRDTLEYKIFFKKEGNNQWLPLVENIYNTNSFTFDSSLLPDGYYNFKLVVSDSPTNTYEEAEISEETTPLYLIDNTPPIIEITKYQEVGGNIRLEGIIEDNAGIVSKAFYSINAKEWIFFKPSDEIFDSSKETFIITIPKKELEKINENNIIFIRALDERDNAKTIEYKIKK
ncbi:MAG TPA: fibronectin type III domain-containing protein [Spirochaetota bacterium]|nr:fibronectin type III domain-containing protein [Spirochaetota bacterium]HOM38251.1 fibronectin type III domain-containing protein [Spirochaetota bacterium]HPQ48531.1 fibronectin type III domain-containing protein [Spirochaetota bacterium]